MRLFRQFYIRNYSPDKGLAHLLRPVLGFWPTHLEYYLLAFTSKTRSTNSQYEYNNERLEFLGDAVLGAIMAEYLYKKYPTRDEGFLTMMRSKMVSRKSMNELGQLMGLDLIIKNMGGDTSNESVLGNTLEAFVGAVYLDRGYADTRTFVITRIVKLFIDVHHLENVNENYKSQLLEWTQRNHKSLDYTIVKQFKVDRRDKFVIAVVIGGAEIARGEDFTKKGAEQDASLRALEKLGIKINN